MVVYDWRQRAATDVVTARLRLMTDPHPQTEEEALNDVFDFIVRRLADEAEESTRECVKAFEAWIENGKIIVATESHDYKMWVGLDDVEKMKKIFKKLDDIFEDLPYYHSAYYEQGNNRIALCVYIELGFR